MLTSTIFYPQQLTAASRKKRGKRQQTVSYSQPQKCDEEALVPILQQTNRERPRSKQRHEIGSHNNRLDHGSKSRVKTSDESPMVPSRIQSFDPIPEGKILPMQRINPRLPISRLICRVMTKILFSTTTITHRMKVASLDATASAANSILLPRDILSTI